jgi:hypothetical protein
MKTFFRSATTALMALSILTACAFSVSAAQAGEPSQAKAHAQDALAAHPDIYDDMIAKYAKRHGVPESLIHRVIMRESRYRPTAMHRIYFGLMQITYATARSMGYKGEPKGLLDAETNLAYAVPYLANAYMVGGKNEDLAVHFYAAGYYFEARRQHKLDLLRTALSEPLTPPPPIPVVAQAPEPAPNPVSMLFHALTGDPAPEPSDAAAVASTAPEVETKAVAETENQSSSVTKKKTAAKKITAAPKTAVTKTMVASNLKSDTKTAALRAVSPPDAK